MSNNVISLFGNTHATPEQQGLGRIEAPILRAAINEVDGSAQDAYAQVLHLPLQKAAAEVVAASVEHGPVAATDLQSEVAELAAYREQAAQRIENDPAMAAFARQALEGTRGLAYGAQDVEEAA